MFATTAQFPQFFDLDGSPLDQGYVYYGRPNEDPETASQQVFWDEAGIITAPQPIRTLNGYLARSGAPTNIFTSGNYSITVRNKRGRLIFTVASGGILSYKAGLSGAVDRTQADRLGDQISVKDFGAKGDGVAVDTAAFTAAKAANLSSSNAAPIRVPAGTYKVAPSFDFGATQWQFDMAAVLIDSATGGPFTGKMNGVALPVALTNAAPIRKGRIASPAVDFQVANSALPAGGTLRDDQMFYQKWYDGTSANSYTLGTSNVYTFTQYGQIKGGAGQKASGSAANLAGSINVFAVDKGTTGRSEITPLAFGVNCFQGYSQAGCNFYMDFNVAGPISGAPADREGFLAGGSFAIKKFTPGNDIDENHDGSYGLSVAHVPGSGGFGTGEQNSVRTYPAKAGLAIVGYSGLPTIYNANMAGADMGFEVGIQVGGPGGSVWLNPEQKVSGSTMVGTAIYVDDWLYNGIRIEGKHSYAGALAPAISVDPSAGPTLLGSAVAPGEARLVVKGYPALNSPAVVLQPDESAASRRVAINIGDHVIGQDLMGDGSKNLFVFTAGQVRLQVSPSGRLMMPNLPTSSTGLTSGMVWRSGEDLKIVP